MDAPDSPIRSHPLRAALRGHYEIVREIGQGAFATVYLARDLKHERKVAIKILNADPTSETGELRFIREIRTVASLQHPNILPLHDSGHVEALLYYVMPYVGGETLARPNRPRKAAALRCSLQHRARGRRRARLRARPGNHSSRHQAGEHPALGRAPGSR